METGLIVVGNGGKPIESVYTMAKSGLFLPRTIPPPGGWIQQYQYQKVHPYDMTATIVKNTIDKMAKPKFIPIPEMHMPTWLTSPHLLPKPLTSPHLLPKPHLPPKVKPYNDLSDIVPGLHYIARYPCGCKEAYTFHNRNQINQIIIHLNDDHKWTRETIADWLDTLTDVDLRVKVA